MVRRHELARAPRLAAWAFIALALLATLNWVVQAVRKPTEVLFPFDGFARTPVETWEAYGAAFREHATAAVPAELLAALAQAESGGNPVARTYWRWRLDWNPVEIYKPASSAVGLYQITDARFEDAKRFCIHGNARADAGPWYDARTCWFNAFYFRILPSHAVEMTAAFLDAKIASAKGSPEKKHEMAAVVHLCGASAGEAFARRGFRPAPGERCGAHDLAAYLARVASLKHEFARLSDR